MSDDKKESLGKLLLRRLKKLWKAFAVNFNLRCLNSHKALKFTVKVEEKKLFLTFKSFPQIKASYDRVVNSLEAFRENLSFSTLAKLQKVSNDSQTNFRKASKPSNSPLSSQEDKKAQSYAPFLSVQKDKKLYGILLIFK